MGVDQKKSDSMAQVGHAVSSSDEEAMGELDPDSGTAIGGSDSVGMGDIARLLAFAASAAFSFSDNMFPMIIMSFISAVTPIC